MALVDDVLAAQVAPRAAVKKQFETAENEVLTLALALAFGFLSFVAAFPSQLAQSQAMDVPLPSVLLPSAFGSIALLPLFLYVIAAIQRGISKLFGGAGSGAQSRRGVVWAMMVAMPWILLSGLISEIAPIWLRLSIGLVALGVFMTTWIIAIILNERRS